MITFKVVNSLVFVLQKQHWQWEMERLTSMLQSLPQTHDVPVAVLLLSENYSASHIRDKIFSLLSDFGVSQYQVFAISSVASDVADDVVCMC